MSQPIDDGGPAFPCEALADYRDTEATKFRGMSLRDWLAGQEKIDRTEDFSWEVCEALAGPSPMGDWKTNPLGWLRWDASWRAAVRYARADAMLAARKGGAE